MPKRLDIQEIVDRLPEGWHLRIVRSKGRYHCSIRNDASRWTVGHSSPTSVHLGVNAAYRLFVTSQEWPETRERMGIVET